MKEIISVVAYDALKRKIEKKKRKVERENNEMQDHRKLPCVEQKSMYLCKQYFLKQFNE